MFDTLCVGYIGEIARAKYGFEYSKEWLDGGFAISPLSLPLKEGLFVPPAINSDFGGLYGVFADSLPDEWGGRLIDIYLRTQGISFYDIDILNRLRFVQENGKGALMYEPFVELPEENTKITLESDFGKIFEDISYIDNNRQHLPPDSRKLQAFAAFGGSSGGTRPKLYVTDKNGDEWLVKFPSRNDPANLSAMEYDYAKCAKHCGIEMPDTLLLKGQNGSVFFAVKRFDRTAGHKKIHMISATGCVEHAYSCDPKFTYSSLFALTANITKSFEDLEQLYRRMCFNVFAHNRDDHSKNFSYLYDTQENCWKLSPAYDLTYSSTYTGGHSLAIGSETQNPCMENLLEIAKDTGFSQKWAKTVACEIRDIVAAELKQHLP